MKQTTKFGALALVAASLFASSAYAVGGQYLRKGKQVINVVEQDGKLFCTRVSDGFEMCNGMVEQANGSWKGKNMRHPAMPKFMKFNGTVIFSDAGLNIRGCALGICKAEDWTKK
jgi:hypothetical protein